MRNAEWSIPQRSSALGVFIPHSAFRIPTMSNLIEVQNLSAKYGDRLVLQDVSMEVRGGEIMVILGGSGCGKTTLLKHIIGLLFPHSGTVRLFERDIARMDERDRNETLRRIGVMFQYGALLNSLTIGENVALPLQMGEGLLAPTIERIVRMKLHLVGLDHAYSLYPPELSGGMRKRAALARALARDPEILFCDEPSAGLDPVTALGIDELLLTLNGELGMTIVVVTHELRSIDRIAHRITMLESGHVLFAGGLQEAKTSGIEGVREFFLEE